MSNSLTVHYYLAHMVLKNQVLENYKNFKEAVDAGPNMINKYFTFLWDKIVENNPDFRNPEPKPILDDGRIFDFAVRQLNNDEKLLTVALPFADEPSEALAITVVMYSDHGRLFAYEFSKNPITGISYHICEWQGDKHLNYGSTETPDINVFTEKVLLIVGANND